MPKPLEPEIIEFNSNKPHLCSGNCCDECHCRKPDKWSYLERDDGTMSLPYPVIQLEKVRETSTPNLVREYTERKMNDARGYRSTRDQHNRHCNVVDELRQRSVLD